jgi:hypothetical protein
MNANLLRAVFFIFISTATTVWCAPIATYVAEFTVIGAGKPEETKTKIQTLLLSRLASDKIATQGKPEGAELKVTGSFIASGSVFSLDAAAVNGAGAVVARAFTQGKNPDELIPAVSILAKSLSEGLDKNASLVAVPVPQVAPAVTPKTVIPSPDLVVPPKSAAVAGQLSIHKMAGAVHGLAIGRTFAGGERELFVTGKHTLRYYRQGDDLKLLAENRYKVHEQVIAVDSADLDNDGSPEIYVTVMNGEVLASQVWTVDGTSLKQIAGPLPYYFRAVAGAGGAKKLYGQQISGTADFSGEVAEVVKTGTNYTLKNPLKLPKQGYLYNFNFLSGRKGERNVIIAERSGYVKVFNVAGDELWKSSEEFGGSEAGFKRTELSNESGSRQVYLDQRIVVKANGELFIPKNGGSWFMVNKHSYSNSSLYNFAWDGTNLEEKWHTKQIDFYLADFAYDESNRELLMLEIVEKEEGIFDKGASRLVIRKVE